MSNWFQNMNNASPADPTQAAPTAAEPAPAPTPEVPPPQPPADSQPAPMDMADQVVADFKKGVNVAPMDMASSVTYTKTAAVVKIASTGHFRHKYFFDCFRSLPNNIKNLARKNFKLMLQNPSLVSLKPIRNNASAEVWSAQVGNHHRALAVKVGSTYVWYWIGSHADYDRRKDSLAPRPQTMPNTQQPKKPSLPGRAMR